MKTKNLIVRAVVSPDYDLGLAWHEWRNEFPFYHPMLKDGELSFRTSVDAAECMILTERLSRELTVRAEYSQVTIEVKDLEVDE